MLALEEDFEQNIQVYRSIKFFKNPYKKISLFLRRVYVKKKKKANFERTIVSYWRDISKNS